MDRWIDVCMYVHTYVHTYTHTYVRTLRTYIHTYYIHTNPHTHTYIHTCHYLWWSWSPRRVFTIITEILCEKNVSANNNSCVHKRHIHTMRTCHIKFLTISSSLTLCFLSTFQHKMFILKLPLHVFHDTYCLLHQLVYRTQPWYPTLMSSL